MATSLFDDSKTKDAVLNCITGEVVGLRPRHVDAVDVRQLRLSEHSELDHNRKAMFNQIFHKRVWGKTPNVRFSASGKPVLSFCPVTNCRPKIYHHCSRYCQTFVGLLTCDFLLDLNSRIHPRHGHSTADLHR